MAGWWAIVHPCMTSLCVAKTSAMDITHKLFNPILLYLPCLIGTIDPNDFIALSVTLTLAGVTRSAQSKTCWLHFCAGY